MAADTMEVVRAFNAELSSVYETKPPISRQKMAMLTKSAMKSLKFYKHVVQSIEKFIAKCRPEYKIPGLYIIDSVVRQSRHQFGPDKDVFASRFVKNIVQTFINLLKCSPDERGKITRVLNLWAKNSVFPESILKPLHEVVADPTNGTHSSMAQAAVDKWLAEHSKPKKTKDDIQPPETQANVANAGQDILRTVMEMLQQSRESTSAANETQQLAQLQELHEQLAKQTQILQSQADSSIDGELLVQIQTLTQQLMVKQADDSQAAPLKKELEPIQQPTYSKVLEFDYGDSDEEKKPSKTSFRQPPVAVKPHNSLPAQEYRDTPPRRMSLDQRLEENFQEPKIAPQTFEYGHGSMLAGGGGDMPTEAPPGGPLNIPPPRQHARKNTDEDRGKRRDDDTRHNRDARRRSRRSRSRSRSRRRRPSRSRSRERQRIKRRSRSRSKSAGNRELERERRRKRLPPLKEKHLIVLTCTIWIGHVSKGVTDVELRTEIERCGNVLSFTMITTRGCAYACLASRKDAARAIERLKDFRLGGKHLSTSWAPGVAIKDSDFREFWDQENGCTYIPFDRLPDDLATLTGGGVLDPDSFPENLKGKQFGGPIGDAPPQNALPGLKEGQPGVTQVPGAPAITGLPAGMPPNLPPILPMNLAGGMRMIPPQMLVPGPGGMPAQLAAFGGQGNFLVRPGGLMPPFGQLPTPTTTDPPATATEEQHDDGWKTPEHKSEPEPTVPAPAAQESPFRPPIMFNPRGISPQQRPPIFMMRGGPPGNFMMNQPIRPLMELNTRMINPMRMMPPGFRPLLDLSGGQAQATSIPGVIKLAHANGEVEEKAEDDDDHKKAQPDFQREQKPWESRPDRDDYRGGGRGGQGWQSRGGGWQGQGWQSRGGGRGGWQDRGGGGNRGWDNNRGFKRSYEQQEPEEDNEFTNTWKDIQSQMDSMVASAPQTEVAQAFQPPAKKKKEETPQQKRKSNVKKVASSETRGIGGLLAMLSGGGGAPETDEEDDDDEAIEEPTATPEIQPNVVPPPVESVAEPVVASVPATLEQAESSVPAAVEPVETGVAALPETLAPVMSEEQIEQASEAIESLVEATSAPTELSSEAANLGSEVPEDGAE